VRVFARVLEGYVSILTNGGDGNKGQKGADGRKGPDSLDKVHARQLVTSLYQFSPQFIKSISQSNEN